MTYNKDTDMWESGLGGKYQGKEKKRVKRKQMRQRNHSITPKWSSLIVPMANLNDDQAKFSVNVIITYNLTGIHSSSYNL